MDNSKINQTELDYSCEAGTAKVNICTGRLLLENFDVVVGRNSFQLLLSRMYNSKVEMTKSDYNCMGKNWRLNIEQYLYKNNNKYLYIDCSGMKIEFENVEGQNYYDTSGLGFVLNEHSTYVEIRDNTNNKMIFENGRLVKTISSENISIEKIYEYTNDKISKIYDSRKPDCRIEFIYSNNLLSELHVIVKNSLKYKMRYYYIDGFLVKVTKEQNNKEKIYMIYEYENGLLKFATYYKNRKSFKFKYLDNKITNVFTGSAKLNVYIGKNSNIYVGDDIYVDEEEYLNNANDDKVQYLELMETFGKDVIKSNKIEYYDTYRIVTNEAGLKFIYFLNSKGYTSSIMECNNINDDLDTYINDLRTLEKMKGEPMLNENCGNNGECINMQKSLQISTNNIITEENYMSERFTKLKQYREHKCTNYIYYVCSFWLKCLGNLSSNKVRLTIKDSRYSNNENISTITFDKSAINSWQEVRIPIMIKDKVIESIKLEFLDNSNTLIKIADMRIYNSSMNNIMIGDENNNNQLENIKKIEYIEQNDTEVKIKNIDDNFYLTEKDLQMTYLGIFKRYGSLEIPLGYSFYYNDCTKCMYIKTATLVDDVNNNYRISFCSDNFTSENALGYARPKYFVRSYSPDGDLFTNHITYFSNKFDIDGEQKQCLIQITEANLFQDTEEAIDHKESYTLTCTDLKGKILLEQDEYGVQNIYKYDVYGVINKKIITSNNEETERLEEIITNDDNTETIKDSLTKNKNYFDDYDNVVKTEFSGVSESQNKVLTKEYSYDSFNESVKEVSDNQGGRNYIKYDSYGQIKELSSKQQNDSNYYGYKFKYNTLGDLTSFFFSHNYGDKLIDKCLISREINRNIEGTNINTYYHRNENSIDLVTSNIDKYGRIIETKYNNDSVKFEYAEISESKGASNITKMIDELDGKTHTYTYNKDNDLVEYGYGDDEEDYLNVKKTSNTKTVLTFINENTDKEKYSLEDEILKDESKLISPRVLYVNQGFEDEDIGNIINYGYDSIGRVTSKNMGAYYEWHNIHQEHDKRINIERSIDYYPTTNKIKKLNSKCRFNGMSLNNVDYDYSYNDKGDLIVNNIESTDEDGNVKKYNHTYTYNIKSQLTSERCEYIDVNNSNNNKTKDINYYYNSDGSISTINTNDGSITYIYEYGKLAGIREKGLRRNLTYDNLGNTLSYGGDTYTYTRGNLLSTHTNGSSTTQYFYNGQGKKYKKILSDGTVITYVYDNEKLISEKHSDGKELIYLYDLDGVYGFIVCNYGNRNYSRDFYYLEKDAMGNVIALMKGDKEFAHYTYDAYGNCEVTSSHIDIANLNPFRWKGMYCELESNLYFIKNNTYSPALRQTLSMNYLDEIVDNSLSIYSLYAYNIGVNNPVEVVYNDHTMYSGHDLTYEEPEKSKWRMFWDSFWRTTLGKYVATRLLALAIVLTVLIAPCTLPGLLYAIGMVGVTLVVGGIIAGRVSQNQGKGFWNGFGNYINENWAQTLAIEMVTYIVTFGITQSLGLGTKCFIEGTLVLTSIGLVKIEDIKPNDEVWSYNEETKERELKKVKQVFRNKTNEWLHLKVVNEETQKEENITCTKSHRIYIKNKGWIEAKDILENDIVLMYNNIQGKVISKELQVLDHFETTYNFEVEDNHNYYVGVECILVHNECHHIISNKGKRGKEIAEEISDFYKVKIDLNHKSNKVNIIGHKGRHTNAYHDMVEKATKTIMSKYDDVNDFYKEIENLGKLIKENKFCLSKGGENICNEILKKFMN